MPTVQGNNQNTAALMGAAMPTQSWAQRRADRQSQLLMRGYLGQMKEQEYQQELQLNQQMAERNEKLANLPILSPDQQRVNGAMDAYRKEVADKLQTKYNGDYKKYRESELMIDAQKFVSKITNSPVIRRAQTNKLNFGLAHEDLQKGDRVARKVTYRLSDGTTKQADWETHYQDFQQGLTETLQYWGSYKQPKGLPDYFTKNYSPNMDINNPMSRFVPQPVTEEDVFNVLKMQEGMSEDDALDYIRRSGIRKGSLYWKFDARDGYRERLLDQRDVTLRQNQQRIDLAGQKGSGSGSGGGGDYSLGQRLFNSENEVPQGRLAGLNVYAEGDAKKRKGEKTTVVSQTPLSLRMYNDRAIEKDAWAQVFGLDDYMKSYKDGAYTKESPEMKGYVLVRDKNSKGEVTSQGMMPITLPKGSVTIDQINEGVYYWPKESDRPSDQGIAKHSLAKKFTLTANSKQLEKAGLNKEGWMTDNLSLGVRSGNTTADGYWGDNTYTFEFIMDSDMNSSSTQAILQNTSMGKLINQAKAQERQDNDFANNLLLGIE